MTGSGCLPKEAGTRHSACGVGPPEAGTRSRRKPGPEPPEAGTRSRDQTLCLRERGRLERDEGAAPECLAAVSGRGVVPECLAAVWCQSVWPRCGARVSGRGVWPRCEVRRGQRSSGTLHTALLPQSREDRHTPRLTPSAYAHAAEAARWMVNLPPRKRGGFRADGAGSATAVARTVLTDLAALVSPLQSCQSRRNPGLDRPRPPRRHGGAGPEAEC